MINTIKVIYFTFNNYNLDIVVFDFIGPKKEKKTGKIPISILEIQC